MKPSKHDFCRGLSVVESRADSLHRFVQSYRAPPSCRRPSLKAVAVAPLVERVAVLNSACPCRLFTGLLQRCVQTPDSPSSRCSSTSWPTLLTLPWPTAAGAHGISFEEQDVELFVEDQGSGIANTENLFGLGLFKPAACVAA